MRNARTNDMPGPIAQRGATTMIVSLEPVPLAPVLPRGPAGSASAVVATGLMVCMMIPFCAAHDNCV